MKKKLKILMILDESLPHRMGGSERYAYEISKGLIRLGNEVVILAGRKQSASRYSCTVLDGIHFYWFKSRVMGRYYPFEAAFLFRKILKRYNFDIINLHHVPFSFTAAIFTMFKNTPKIFTFYAPWANEHELDFKKSYVLKSAFFDPRARFIMKNNKIILNLMEGCCVGASSKIIALSEYSRELIQNIHSLNGKEAKIIPGAADYNRFMPLKGSKESMRKRLSLPEDKFILLTVRRLVARMGLENLIKAMSCLISKRKDILLLIAGEGYLKNSLRGLVDQYNLYPYVKLLGFIPDKDLPFYYQAADMFILPSEKLEGFGLVTVESLACGTPVLGTSVGGTPEILTGLDKNLLFKSAQPEDMARLILYYINSPDKLESIRKRSREYVMSRYSWNKAAEETLKVYQKTIDTYK